LNINSEILSDKLRTLLNNVSDFAPESFLASLFLVIIILDLILRSRSAKIIPWLALSGFLIALFLVLRQLHGPAQFLFMNMILLDKIAVIFKILFLSAAILTVLFSELSPSFNPGRKGAGEYYAILAAIVLGLNLMAMASNLLMVYLAIEFVSIGSYILTTYNFNKKSAEAGMKYILFGAFSSGIMLYGMSLLYGFTGSLGFDSGVFKTALSFVDPIALYFCLFLISAGILFKISVVPFHIWAPDIYEGAPTPVVAFFSIAPKAAGFALLLKFVSSLAPLDYFGQYSFFDSGYLQNCLAVLVLVTLTVGNFSALLQNNAKRMLAYSSIAHAGFILTGVLAFSKSGLTSILFYLPVYLFMNFGAFILVDVLSDLADSEDVRNFKGLGIKFPFIGVIFVLIMIALTGLPPTAGFFAKFFVFSAIWGTYQATGKQIFMIVFLFGLLNNVISLFYYLKIPYYMFFKKGEKNMIKYPSKWVNILVSLVTIPLLVLFFKPDWLINLINR
jgi:NADH-quinone oxidoreductase subunit N